MPTSKRRGFTLIDTVVGTALMLISFLGIYGAFQLSVYEVSNDKARAGAIALANERMEYIRSLPYSSVGTSGGIPSGSIAQSESVSLNNVNYTRRTFIEYEDDPKDGIGAADANHVVEDYKSAKVDVAWSAKGGTRHVTIVTRVSPVGIESSVPGGTLTISSINSTGQPVANASVLIVNSTVSPTVSINTFTDTTGVASFLGAPAGSGYQVTVTKTGYSTAQTYSVTAQNTNPNPGNLTVTNNLTTSATFAIDQLGSKTISTWTQILSGNWSDTFSDATKVATSTNISIASSTARLTSTASPGEVQSIDITPSLLASWGTLTVTATKPAQTMILYHVYDLGGNNLIPDAQLPGNSTGISTSTINLSGVSTTTYSSIRLDAVLSASSSATPSIDLWNLGYTYGPQPLGNIAISVQGAKTIGSGPGGTLYKYSTTTSTSALGSITIPNLEWDNYTTTVNSSSGYDVASACGPQPESLSPGASMTTNLYLASHTTNSLLVDVRSSASGSYLKNATVGLSVSGYAATSTTDSCGQAFFSGLSSGTYSISVSSPGYTTFNSSSISVSGTSRYSASLN